MRHAFLSMQTFEGENHELVVAIPDQDEERNYEAMLQYISDCDGAVFIDRDCQPDGRTVLTVDEARTRIGLDRDD